MFALSKYLSIIIILIIVMLTLEFDFVMHGFRSIFSYYNEEFYNYFVHQIMFAVTELIVTAVVLNLCNHDNSFSLWKVCTIIAINLVHIIVSGMDQFIVNVVQGKGYSFQNFRDVGLMVPDVLHVLIPLQVFYQHAQRQKLRITELCYKEEVILMFVFISLGTVVGRFI